MTAQTISLTVNGRQVAVTMEPRAQLAEVLREHLLLTGTHLGCEHGVCGACTVYVDGSLARSCITYAIACEGAEVTTIEGFDDDEVMAELRAAFSREHALQCGYCTPGMLATARDIVCRLPDADEDRIRMELSGNLCRCTGYVGIVRAVGRVLEARKANGVPNRSMTRAELGPVGSGHAVATGAAGLLPNAGPETAVVPPAEEEAPATRAGRSSTSVPARDKPGITIGQSFSVGHPRARVWAFFEQVDEVVTCMPGASLTETSRDDHVRGEIRIKLGPISADFTGEADIERDADNYRGRIWGRGRDTRSSSSARGELIFSLFEENGGAATRVDIELGVTLTGSLAQFSRSAIVSDLAGRLTAEFARNLRARLDGAVGRPALGAKNSQSHVTEVNVGSLVMSVLWARIKAFFSVILRC